MSDPDSALRLLDQWPIVQATVAIMIILAGIYLMLRGERGKKQSTDPMPQWLMMGPLHDMMGAVHDVAEQSRRTNEFLREIRDISANTLRQTEMTKSAIESIHNESKMLK